MRQKKLMAVVITIVMAIAALVPTMAFAKSKPARPNGNRPIKMTQMQKKIHHNSMEKKMRQSHKMKKHEERRHHHKDYRPRYYRSRYEDYVYYNSLLNYHPLYVPSVGTVYVNYNPYYNDIIAVPANINTLPFLIPVR